MDKRYEVLENLKTSLYQLNQEKDDFNKSKLLILNTLKREILSNHYNLNQAEIKFLKDNDLDLAVVNYLDNKDNLKEQLDFLKIIQKEEIDYYKSLYDYIDKEVGNNQTYNEIDKYKLMNVIHFIENNETDLSVLKRQNKELKDIYANDTLKQLDPMFLFSPYNFNNESLYYYDIALNQYLSSLNQDEFAKLIKKEAYDKDEYIATYNQKPFSYSEKELKTAFDYVRNNAKKDLEIWNNFKESDKQDLLKAVKFTINQNENNFQKQGAYVLNNYLNDYSIREFLHNAYSEQFMYKNKSQLRKQYQMFYDNVNHLVNNSRVKNDFENTINHFKSDSFNNKILNENRLFNQRYISDYQTIAQNQEILKEVDKINHNDKVEYTDTFNKVNPEGILTKISEADMIHFKEIINHIPDYQLYDFICSYYEIYDNELPKSKVLDNNGKFNKNIKYQGKEYSDKEFRNEIQNALINHFILDDDEDGEHNITELYKNRYVKKNGRYYFNPDLILKQNNKTFHFDLTPPYNKYVLNKNEDYVLYTNHLNELRNNARSYFDHLINTQQNHQEQYKENMAKLKNISDRDINKLRKDGVGSHLLNLMRKRYVLMGLMIFNLPLALGIMGITFLAHRISLWNKKRKNNKLLEKYKNDSERYEKERDFLNNNKLQTFKQLLDKQNKIDDRKFYEKQLEAALNRYDTQNAINKNINKLKLPLVNLDNLNNFQKEDFKNMIDNYVNVYHILDADKNNTTDIDLNKFVGENNDEKLVSFQKFFNEIWTNDYQNKDLSKYYYEWNNIKSSDSIGKIYSNLQGKNNNVLSSIDNFDDLSNKVNNELEKDKAYYNDIVIESKKSQNSKGRSR